MNEVMETGVKALWVAVLQEALETATTPVNREYNLTYRKRVLDRNLSIRFFKYPDRYNLPFACAVLGLNTEKVAKIAMKQIRESEL